MEVLLHHALNLASQGLGQVAPNPAVGAVLIRDGVVVGEGWHRGPGRPHAEVEAIRLAGDRARGAVLFVSLEPCNHTGRTGPCTEAIRKAGVRRVVYGHGDPNPEVRGGGAQQLREWGIEVEQCETPRTRRFYRDYAHWVRTGLPRFVAKLAVSSDGKVAGASGQPVKLSGDEADRFTHEQRCEADGVLTTAATVIADDPQMNSRFGDQVRGRPVWVLDREGKFPSGATLWKTAGVLHLVVGTEVEWDPEWEKRGAVVHQVDAGPGGLDLAAVKKRMGAHGLHRVWIEAGPTLFEALGDQQLLDQAFIYHCPVEVGEDGLEAFGSTHWCDEAKVTWDKLGADERMKLEYPCSLD